MNINTKPCYIELHDLNSMSEITLNTNVVDISEKLSDNAFPLNTTCPLSKNYFDEVALFQSMNIEMVDDNHTLSETIDFYLEKDKENIFTLDKVINPEVSLILHSIKLVKLIEEKDITQLYILSENHIIASFKNVHLLHSNVNNQIKLIFPFLNQQQTTYSCAEFVCINQAFKNSIKPYYEEMVGLLDHPLALITGPSSEQKSIAFLINWFIEEINITIRSCNYKRAKKNRDERMQERIKILHNYLSNLRQLKKRLLVVRVDFYFPKDKKQISLAEAKRLFNYKFLQSVRRKTAFDLIGYIWKLEFAPKQGLHYHCIFFFSGRTHCQDIQLGRMLGEIWDKTVEGKNSYFNCNHPSNRKKYREDVLGMIDHHDSAKYEALKKVLLYFCKKEQFLIHNALKGQKAFDTGMLPKVKPSQNNGSRGAK